MILDNDLTGETHGRVKPSGDMFLLTILRVPPGPMEAETLPETAARSKRREQRCDIPIRNERSDKKNDNTAETNLG